MVKEGCKMVVNDYFNLIILDGWHQHAAVDILQKIAKHP